MARTELSSVQKPWCEWYYPTGQRVAMCMVRVEGRIGLLEEGEWGKDKGALFHCLLADLSFGIRAGEMLVLNANTASPFPITGPDKPLAKYLTDREAAAIAIARRRRRGLPLKACNYDPVVMELLGLKPGPDASGGFVSVEEVDGAGVDAGEKGWGREKEVERDEVGKGKNGMGWGAPTWMMGSLRGGRRERVERLRGEKEE